ncbi:uncharacterized protein ACN63O_019687 [Diretmus argenteus]
MWYPVSENWRVNGSEMRQSLSVSLEESIIGQILQDLATAQGNLEGGGAPEEEVAGHGDLPRQEAPFPGCGPSPGPLPGSGSPASLMELLPTQGQTLRHYTASRPRPRRTHTQPPSSRPQEPVSETENEANEGMGRVDEGVEEFFTKKIIPDYALKCQWEESISAQATPPESSSTPSAPTPFSPSSDDITSSTITTSSSVPSSNTSFTSTVTPHPSSSVTPPVSSSITSTTAAPPSKNIKKKFGDFFAFKKARAGRAAKAGGGEGGGGEGAKVKRTSIADLIRPLREAKEREREREREREKEREKERGTRSVEDVNVSNDAAVTEGNVATGHHLPGKRRDKMAPTAAVTTSMPPSDATPPSPSTVTPDLATAVVLNPEEEAVTSLPVRLGHTPSLATTSPVTTSPAEQEKEKKGGGTPHGERSLKVTKRSLREGKSQSLILLTGLEPEDKDNAHSKKHASESTSSFEQRLQVMLHRMGVAKTSPANSKTSQNKEEELRKANSEGAILDKPEPPPTFMKPRTMSTSSDTRHPVRLLDPLHTDPPLPPKPVLLERPVGPLPPKPAIAHKPPLPTPGGGFPGRPAPQHLPSSAPPSTSSAGGVQPRPPTHDGRAGETQTQNESQDDRQPPASSPSPRKEVPPPAPSPRRGPSAQDRSEKAQSVTDESLPKPRSRMKPLPQRRAMSVHEDTLAMTQE